MPIRYAIIWSSIYLDRPIRGVCIKYDSNNYEIDAETGLPKGIPYLFNVPEYDSKNYNLHSLTDEDIAYLKSERRLTVAVMGPVINHDKNFCFDEPSSTSSGKLIALNHFTPSDSSIIEQFKLSQIVNPNPWDLRNGINF